MTLEINKIYCMDALEGMRQMDSESVDLVVTDPPYGIGYKSNCGSERYKEKLNDFDWDDEFNFGVFYDEFMRVLKNDSYMYVFGRFENAETMKYLGCDRILVWDKQHCGMGDLTDWGIGYELIYLFKKGNPKLSGGRVNGVIPHKHIGYFEKTLHPTQKPVELLKFLMVKSGGGSLVLDPFIGSGTTAVAAKQLGRNFIGFELEQKYVDIANSRLAQTQLEGFFE